MIFESQNERINYLKERIYGNGKIVYIDDDMIPDTFAQDMEYIFKVDPEMDILRGAAWGDDGLVDCTVVVIENDMSREEILVALADYVNGIKIQYIQCAFQNEEGRKLQFELDLDDEYVEGPSELIVGDILVLDESNLLIERPLSLGLKPEGEPSDVAKAIAEGRHFIKELIDINDERLI